MLLAKMDARHETPCGHAVKKLCERGYRVFNDENYSDLANISVSHLYNLRHSKSYQNQRRCFTKTNPRQIVIGERKKPQPEGKPGYIRINTVHQGDQDKVKGVYHINAVDEETQFEIVCSVERISEQYLLPVLEQMLAAFPFKIIKFHSDNGAEYINKPVLELLNKLLIDFTKSRSRHSNDNALAESKNMMTPYDKLKSLPDSEKYLKPEVTFSALDEFAMKMSDNESAELLLKERQKLFSEIFNQQNTA